MVLESVETNCQNSWMQFVGPWTPDPETLAYAYGEWIQQHHPSGEEILSVNQWLERAHSGPDFVGLQDPPDSGRYYGRVPDTNIVVEYTADASVLRIWISKIAPRA
jgi:hypothetical protein